MPSTEPTAAERAAVERPILFSGPMVRAILEGRKTQTRRVMPPLKHPNWTGYMMAREGYAIECGPDYPDDQADHVRCPYGVAGDRLWVRETFCIENNEPDPVDFPPPADGRPVRWHELPNSERFASYPRYRATEPQVYLDCEHENCSGAPCRHPWHPSIHMPRWASRILLEIIEVWAQRLKEISVEDCIAEGLSTKLCESEACDDLKSQFQALWDSINEKRGFGWSKNPWVFGVSFKRVAR